MAARGELRAVGAGDGPRMSRAAKRAFDLAVSGLLLVPMAPLLGALWLLVRLGSPGPALFRQTRVGRQRAPFQVLKLRTMAHRDPALVDQRREAVVTAGSDPRITRLGRFLRATSLDELPQLFNVLRGDMSLVGPRPVLPEQLAAIPPERMTRFAVRPGVTGLAQVRGRRSLDWPDQLAFDAEYVERWSFWLDLVILARTVWVVVTGSGVYGPPGRNWRQYVIDTEAPPPGDARHR